MSENRYCQVVTVTDARELADTLARSAVEAGLAACAQVDGPVTSVYRWQGAVETAQEWRITFKTTTARYAALEHHIGERHHYDVPEILCGPVTAGHPAYLAWLDAETAER